MQELYNIIFKRKSVRKYDYELHLSDDELFEIKEQTKKLTPLFVETTARFELTPIKNTTAKRGEYCLLIYSKNNPLELLNAGYMLEQMDLWLSSKNIGVCWVGLAKSKEKSKDDLDYIIMLEFGKSSSNDFRENVSEFKRKDNDIIWQGNFDQDVINAVSLSPSAVNSQPWRFFSKDNMISVFRDTKAKSIIPPYKKPFLNTIDMGISLCFLEIALKNKGYVFERTLITDSLPKDHLLKIAQYQIK